MTKKFTLTDVQAGSGNKPTLEELKELKVPYVVGVEFCRAGKGTERAHVILVERDGDSFIGILPHNVNLFKLKQSDEIKLEAKNILELIAQINDTPGKPLTSSKETGLRVNPNVYIDDAWDRHEENPDTFQIPSANDLMALQQGDLVKLCFMQDEEGERMWVELIAIDEENTCLVGRLDNEPVIVDLKKDDIIEFDFRQIMDFHVMDRTKH